MQKLADSRCRRRSTDVGSAVMGKIATAAVVVGVLAVGSVILSLVWLWTGSSGVADRVGAMASATQAFTAAVIVVLTGVLAWLAYASLSATRTQAEAAVEAAGEAGKANTELRVERELGVLPYLSLEVTPTVHPDHTVGLSIMARNHSSHPALDVTVTLYRGPWSDVHTGDDPAVRVDLIRDTSTVREVIPASEAKTFGWQLPASEVGEVVLLRLRYSGQLGGTVWQTYEMRPRDSGQPDWFRRRERVIVSSIPAARKIVIR
jgi:hypothetical protein